MQSIAKNADFHYNRIMFEWRFRITPEIIPIPFLETAYFAGWGRVPRLTHANVRENELIVRAESFGSGTIHVPMPHQILGVVMESTESLLSRQQPYSLVRELARGAIGRFYRRLFDWQMLGFQQPQEHADRMQSIAKRFSGLITKDPFEENLEQEFVSVLNEMEIMILEENKEFSEQSCSWRMRNDNRLPITLAVKMPDQYMEKPLEVDKYAKLLQDSFQAVLPMPTWRELEPQPDQFNWERLEKHLSLFPRFGFQIVFGPLLSFSTNALPDWLFPHLMEEGYFESRATRFVNLLAERYGHHVHSWFLCNRFVDQSFPHMPLERTLSLVHMLAQQLRSKGIDVPFIVGITQPWGEYALQQTPGWEQVQIAEALMSCRDIDAFLIEINLGFGPHLTWPRDPMTIGNMIDQWSFLGKKVYVSISVPSSGNPIAIETEFAQNWQWSEERQRVWTETLLLTILGKRAVRGIFWSHLQDSSESSNAMESDYGLVSAGHTMKPAFKHFYAARKNLLE